MTDPIETRAAQPAEAEVDGERVKAHPIPDQIAAERYAQGKAAKANKATGLRFARLIPPGSV